jgi:hypothetical protein
MLKLSTHSGFHDLFLNSPKNNTIDDVEKYMYTLYVQQQY